MKLNLSVIVSTITLVVAFFMNQELWWIPASVLVAGLIDTKTRVWVMSPRLGSITNLSMALKGICALVGLYAMVGIVACLWLLISWFS